MLTRAFCCRQLVRPSQTQTPQQRDERCSELNCGMSSQKEPCHSRALPPAHLGDKSRLGTSVPRLSVLALGLVIYELNSGCKQCQQSSVPQESPLGHRLRRWPTRHCNDNLCSCL